MALGNVGSGIANFWNGMNPETQAALVQGGLGAVGGYLQGKGQEQQAKFTAGANLLGSANNNQLQTRMNRTSTKQQDFDEKRGELNAADELVLNAMGKSPLEFANERGGMKAKAEIYSKGVVPSYLRNLVPEWMASGLSPETIQMMTPTAEKEQPYWNAVAQASKGRFKGANLGASYGDSGRIVDDVLAGTTQGSGKEWSDLWGNYEKTRDAELDDTVGVSDSQRQQALALMDAIKNEPDPQKKQGFLSKLGGILKVVGPIAAMAIPGVGPIAAMAISAASNAAGTKMQGGSWGQALAGAGLSAATQGMLGGLGGKTPPIMNLGKTPTPLSMGGFTPPRANLLPWGGGRAVAGGIGV